MHDHPNVAFVEQAYKAMGAGDIPWIEEHTSADIVFHQTGTFPMAGTFHGRDAMFGHFMEFVEFTGGDFTLEPQEILVNDDRAVVLLKGTFGRNGAKIVIDEVHLWRIDNGICTEIRAIPEDPYALDRFFSQ